MKVIFFPRNDYPNNVEICNHRLGKKVTYCECTTDIPDFVQNTILPYFVTAHNTKSLKVGTYFGWQYLNSAWNTVYGKQCIADGVIWPDLYFYPGSDLSEEHILSVYNNDALPFFVENFGKKPIAIDFSSGIMSYKSYLANKFLAADSSLQDLSKTDYGVGVGIPNNVPYSQERYYPRNMNSRVLDNARADIIANSAYNTPQEKDYYDYYINQMSDLIDDTLALQNGGFIMNFHHWHDLVKMDYNTDGTPIAGRNDYAINNGFKPYIDMLCQKNVNNEIYFAGYGEAVAYLLFRQYIQKAVMYSPNDHPNDHIIIRLEVPNSLNVDTELLSVPISVKFSTNGTPLANSNIRCKNHNLVSIGNNQYIVEIPYNEYAGVLIEKVIS